MDRRLRAELAAEELDRAVGDDLVGVHVGLRSRPGLPHHERDVVGEAAVDDLVGGAGDGVDELAVEHPELSVDDGRGLLDDAERPDDRQRHAVGTDSEVLQRSLGLRPPVAIGGHLDRTEGIGLGAVFGQLGHNAALPLGFNCDAI